MTYQISNTNTFENVHLKYQNAHLHVYALFHTFGACNILCACTVAHQIIDVFTNECRNFLLIDNREIKQTKSTKKYANIYHVQNIYAISQHSCVLYQ